MGIFIVVAGSFYPGDGRRGQWIPERIDDRLGGQIRIGGELEGSVETPSEGRIVGARSFDAELHQVQVFQHVRRHRIQTTFDAVTGRHVSSVGALVVGDGPKAGFSEFYFGVLSRQHAIVDVNVVGWEASYPILRARL